MFLSLLYVCQFHFKFTTAVHVLLMKTKLLAQPVPLLGYPFGVQVGEQLNGATLTLFHKLCRSFLIYSCIICEKDCCFKLGRYY